MSLVIRTPPRPPQGTCVVNVLDYGARPDGGATDNTKPFQDAHDALAARTAGTLKRGVLYVPSGDSVYGVNGPVWVDAPNVEVRGDGWGSVVQVAGPTRCPAFIFGVPRVQSGRAVDASYRPDLFGKLDASVTPAPGRLFGFRTNGDSFVQYLGGPMSAGPGPRYPTQWGETSRLTVEFCVEAPGGGPLPPRAPLFGMGYGVGGANPSPCPFWVSTLDDAYSFNVSVRSSDMAGPSYRSFDVSAAGLKAPWKVALQFDLAADSYQAYVNGKQVAVLSLAGPKPTSGTLMPNGHYPFMIGAQGLGGPYGQRTADFALYGLRLSDGLRYQDSGVGTPQSRLDAPGTPPTDAYSYFGNDALTVGYLACTDDPATAGRVVSFQTGLAAGDRQTMGVLMHNVGPTINAYNAIRDIAVAGEKPHGQVICLGGLFEFTAENVKATDGYHGIGSFPCISTYNVYLKDVNLDGSDAPYFGCTQIISADSVYFASSGRVTVRLVGCGATWNNTFVAGWSPPCEHIVKASGEGYGGAYTFANMVVDFEGYPVGKSAFYCEYHYATPATSLTLRDIYLGTVGPGASLVALRDLVKAADGRTCWLSVENLQAWDDSYQAAFDVDGPLWHGDVRGTTLSGTQLVHRETWGKGTGILVHDTRFVGNPRTLAWRAGAHALEVRCPADGQFSEWRCVSSGEYGTPRPPVWAGVHPLPATPGGMAAYAQTHCYVTASLN